MILFGPPLTKKEVRVMPFDKLINLLLINQVIRCQKIKDHIGAFREQKKIVVEIAHRCNIKTFNINIAMENT